MEEVSYLCECKTIDSSEVVAGSCKAIVKGITEEAANTETGDLQEIKYRRRRQGAPTEAEEEALAARHHPQPFLMEPRPAQISQVEQRSHLRQNQPFLSELSPFAPFLVDESALVPDTTISNSPLQPVPPAERAALHFQLAFLCFLLLAYK